MVDVARRHGVTGTWNDVDRRLREQRLGSRPYLCRGEHLAPLPQDHLHREVDGPELVVGQRLGSEEASPVVELAVQREADDAGVLERRRPQAACGEAAERCREPCGEQRRRAPEHEPQHADLDDARRVDREQRPNPTGTTSGQVEREEAAVGRARAVGAVEREAGTV